ncbi:hypothetical protein GKQ23_13085 [Erwinia sp. E602]|uniref:hypothetical protein n=1 Tax=Erwinia sp. E602 TaxID=2675378 RepID=UPI001BAC1486|nr:hypothetical protein [Erwinia sp. E602]QUG75868.1 hypothetical protein GKQ23_13085 [Erwinia sp. E602]
MNTTNTLTLTELQNRYGFDVSVISRWQDKGLDLTWPEGQISSWVVQNIITPMRKTDANLKNEKLVEEIRLTKARADQQEIDTKRAADELVLVEEVADELMRYCLLFKTSMRNLPTQIYLDLAALSDDSIAMRNFLSEKIDEVLNELGQLEYEAPKPKTKRNYKKRDGSTKAATEDTTE